MTGAWSWVHDAFDVVGALAAAGAVIVALLLASRERTDRKAAEVELKNERQTSQRAAREAQARRVVGWFERRVVHSVTGLGGKTVHEYRPYIAVGNYSDEPVFDVRATAVRLSDNLAFETDAPVVPPGATATETEMDSRFNRAGETVGVAVRFRDVRGVVWTRLADGRLREEIR